MVPADQRGTKDCPFLMPRGTVEIDVTATAIDNRGEQLSDFFGPVSFRSVPGDLTGDYPNRWALAHEGVVAATVKVAHLFGEVRVWAEDAPPQLIYDGGTVTGTTEDLPGEPERRTFATGLSPILYFEEPTLAKVQIPDGHDNRTSPLVGQFLTIGKNPDSNARLLHSCTDDPERDGQEALMVVTGTDPSGFFVTDVNSCRLKEELADPNTGSTTVRVPEPSGYLPGTFGSMFIYNYSFPEGLDQGDLLWTLSGAVQEFTSTTQLTFPAWSIREKVRQLPPSEWDRYLRRVSPVELSLRHCGLDQSPFVTDVLCGHNRRNMKLESLESSLVKVRDVRVPQVFTHCDLDADGEVPFFCETIVPVQPEIPCQSGSQCPSGTCDFNTGTCGQWGWSDCSFEADEVEPPELAAERQCHIDCATGQGQFADTLCAERATFVGFGQFIIEMAGPGPAEAGLDPTIAQRLQPVPITATPARTGSFPVGADVRVWCDTAVRFKAGDTMVTASSTDTALAARTLFEHRVTSDAVAYLSFVADGAALPGASCTVAMNSHTRLNLVVKDAVPELQPDCRTDDPDAQKAEQCRFFRGATYDVVGHLRHLQPGRPRWVILPRDAEDLCCRPGPGLSCPKPIKPCP